MGTRIFFEWGEFDDERGMCPLLASPGGGGILPSLLGKGWGGVQLIQKGEIG